jgi:hypothetical protein
MCWGERESYKNNFKQHLLVNCEVFLVPFVDIGFSVAPGIGIGIVLVVFGIVLVVFTPLKDLTKNWIRHVWEGNNLPGDDLPTKICA